MKIYILLNVWSFQWWRRALVNRTCCLSRFLLILSFYHHSFTIRYHEVFLLEREMREVVHDCLNSIAFIDFFCNFNSLSKWKKLSKSLKERGDARYGGYQICTPGFNFQRNLSWIYPSILKFQPHFPKFK